MSGTTNFGYTGTIQFDTITSSGTFALTLAGAQGGSVTLTTPYYYATGAGPFTSAAGGVGAIVSGDIYLAAGTVLEIIVGGVGASVVNTGGGGGGGTFVFEEPASGSTSAATLLAVAGGGGGAYFSKSGWFAGPGPHSEPYYYAGTSGSSGTSAGSPGLAKPDYLGGGGGGFTGGAGTLLVYNPATQQDTLTQGQNGKMLGTTFAGGSAQPGSSNGSNYTGGAGGFGGGGGGSWQGGGGGGGDPGGYGGNTTNPSGGGGGSYYPQLTDVSVGYQPVTFQGGNYGAGAMTITLLCFYPGTSIATPSSHVAVENLRAGDMVMTANGALPVRWIGMSHVSRRFADPLRVLPIRIKAGALGEGLPVRDLLLSPDHALFLDGILIQAGAMVNGTSIVREQNVPETFTYYHVELASHELLFAEGVPSESFVDNVDRMHFSNWAEHEALGDMAPIQEMPYPRAKSHRQMPQAVWQFLLQRARQQAVEAA